jgi:hypothetical protein
VVDWCRALGSAQLTALGAPKPLATNINAIDAYSALDVHTTLPQLASLLLGPAAPAAVSMSAEQSQALAVPLVTKLVELGLVLHKIKK